MFCSIMFISLNDAGRSNVEDCVSYHVLCVIFHQSVLRNNTNVLCCLAENYFLAGDYTNAGLVYQRVHSLDPLNITGMDFYAFILHKEKKSVELRRYMILKLWFPFLFYSFV